MAKVQIRVFAAPEYFEFDFSVGPVRNAAFGHTPAHQFVFCQCGNHHLRRKMSVEPKFQFLADNRLPSRVGYPPIRQFLYLRHRSINIFRRCFDVNFMPDFACHIFLRRMRNSFQDIYFAESGVTKTIQNTPNLSSTMPNFAEKKVLASGISTLPPAASAANAWSTSASVGRDNDSANPSNVGLPEARPSDAIRVVLPIWSWACITLFGSRGPQPGGGGSGLSLNRISRLTWAPRDRKS